MNWYSKLFLSFVLLASVACSSSETAVLGDDDDDDNGDEVVQTLDTSTLAGTLQEGAQSLVLSISAGDVTASLSDVGFQAALSGTTEQWDQYFGENSYYLLTDIFGPANEPPAVVTKISVQLESVFGSLENILNFDAEVNCVLGDDGLPSLAEIQTFDDGDADTIELPFFGEIANGVAGDRRFECIVPDREAMIYGLTSDGTFSFAILSDDSYENTESPEERGDAVRLAQVTLVTYAESTEADVTTGFLDLQYAQATIYNGPDGDFQIDVAESADDIIFKSRSRITGTFGVDADGNPTAATGEFFVTKYDLSYTPDDQPVTTITQAHGRGGYAAEEYSIFDIVTDSDQVTDANGSFCLQMPTSGSIPSTADESNCTTLETDFAWGATTFLFDIAPTIEQVFADATLFEDDATGLIANDLSNFTMPAYYTNIFE